MSSNLKKIESNENFVGETTQEKRKFLTRWKDFMEEISVEIPFFDILKIIFSCTRNPMFSKNQLD